MLGKPVHILLRCTHSSAVLQALLHIFLEDPRLSYTEGIAPKNLFVDICGIKQILAK